MAINKQAIGRDSYELAFSDDFAPRSGSSQAKGNFLLFFGYDPGGRGTHGVAVIETSREGQIINEPTCDVVEHADAALEWFSNKSGASALGIDTLLAWSPFGGRKCDDALRRKYIAYARTVIPQNALYSSMTLNGAIVAKNMALRGVSLFESHPKLLINTAKENDQALQEIVLLHSKIKASGGPSPKDQKRADDKADAVVAAWCAAQGFLKRWKVDLYRIPGDQLELVATGASYPWHEAVCE